MIQIEERIRKLFQEVENEDTKLQILENDLRENDWAEKKLIEQTSSILIVVSENK